MPGGYALTFGRGARRHALLSVARSQGLDVIDRDGLLLVTEADMPRLEAGDAVLLGQVFSKDHRRLNALPDGLANWKPTPGADDGLGGCWGNFVLFNGASDRPSVYRDPSGNVPTYRCGEGLEAVFVSDAAFAGRLELLADPRIDLTFVIHWLQFPFLRTRRTGLSAVTELLPGMCAQLRPDRQWSEHLRWSPSPYARSSAAIFDSSTATCLVRHVTPPVVAAQIAPGRVLLELSGGLDSSIIAACLAGTGHKIAAVNFATRSPDGDERDFARAVARHLGLALDEIEETGPAVLIQDRDLRFAPATNPLLMPIERAVEAAAARAQASLLVDGAGGDNLFCSLATAAPVIDALLQGGPKQACRTARDIAERANCSWWHVLKVAARRLVRPRPRWKEDRSFLNPRVLIARPDLHPWMRGRHGIAPGKREHVEALVHIQHFLDRGSARVARLHPLLAQPLLEACLRIPTWMWVAHGRDRAVARDAFAGLLPPAALARRTKGSLQSMFHRSFAVLGPRIRELLLLGELRRLGIIDAEAVTLTLDGRECPDEVQLRITELVAMELWLQSWRLSPTNRATPS